MHVMPGSSQAMFPSGYNPWRKCLEIKVRSDAKDNKANHEVIETLASFFQLKPNDVTLVSGQKSREKTMSLKNITMDAVCKKLEESLHGL